MSLRKLPAFRHLWIIAIALLSTAGLVLILTGIEPARVHAGTTLGSPLPGLTNGQLKLFNVGQLQFNVRWGPSMGLGPVYTNFDCAKCHAQPVGGGTNSTKRTEYFGTTNSDGSFNPLTSEGGFILQPFSVANFIRSCSLRGEMLPTDATLTSQRVPIELFGDGLIDSIDDTTIQAFAGDKGMGINGSPNMVPDWNGTIRVGHFGFKAQLASLVQASGFAFLHDIGVTNPVVLGEDCPNAPPGDPNVNMGACPLTIVPQNCVEDQEPNDFGPPVGKETIQIFDYVVFLAPNMAGTGNSNGQALFTSIGCALCHNPSYQTDPARKIPTDFAGHTTQVITALSNQTASLYSDLLIHHMGPGLADCMQLPTPLPSGGTQANGDQWRTAPLWGLSTRTVYLHDGRTTDLMTAIEKHSSFAGASACGNTYIDSEANQVISNFNALSTSDQGDLLAFINSL